MSETRKDAMMEPFSKIRKSNELLENVEDEDILKKAIAFELLTMIEHARNEKTYNFDQIKRDILG